MMLLRTQAPTCSYTEKGGQCAEEKLRRCAFDIFFGSNTPVVLSQQEKRRVEAQKRKMKEQEAKRKAGRPAAPCG